MVKNNFNKKDLKRFILEKYPTLRACAEAMGIDEHSLQGRLTRGANKTLFKLAELGVNIPGISENKQMHIYGDNNSTNQGDNVNYSGVNNGKIIIKENNVDYKAIADYLQKQVIELSNEVDRLKKIILNNKMGK